MLAKLKILPLFKTCNESLHKMRQHPMLKYFRGRCSEAFGIYFIRAVTFYDAWTRQILEGLNYCFSTFFTRQNKFGGMHKLQCIEQMIFSTHYTPGYATIRNDKTMFLIWLMSLHAALWSIYGAWNMNLSETQLKLNFLPKGCTDYFDGCSTSRKIETPNIAGRTLKITCIALPKCWENVYYIVKWFGVQRLGQNSELSITINEKVLLWSWWNNHYTKPWKLLLCFKLRCGTDCKHSRCKKMIIWLRRTNVQSSWNRGGKLTDRRDSGSRRRELSIAINAQSLNKQLYSVLSQ